MKIAIIGTGNIGGALARLWAARNRRVILGLRDSDAIQAAKVTFPNIEAAVTSEAVQKSEVVVLAIPWSAVPTLLSQAGSLAGKTLIETTNPLLPDLKGLEITGSTSAAELIQQWQPTATVVKAFNSLGASLLGNARIAGALANGFYCGNDPASKEIARELICDAGLDPCDVGPLQNARYLEAMAMLWIDMAVNQKKNGRFGFKLLVEPAA